MMFIFCITFAIINPKKNKIMKKVTYAMLIIILPLLGKSQTVNVPDVEICFNWNTVNTVWDSTSKTMYQYTNYIKDGEVLKSQRISYSYVSNAWQPSWRYNWEWNGYLLLKDSSENYVGGNWQNSQRTMYQYDANANEIVSQFDTWNSNTWQPNQKQLKQYNSNNLITEKITQNYTANTWVNANKKIYSYDSNNIQNLEIGFTWNTNTTVWDSSYKNVMDIQSNIATGTYYNYAGNTWQPQVQNIIKIRDWNANLFDYFIQATWNTGTTSWDSVYKVVNTYDANNNLLSEEGYSYNNGWVPAGKTNYTYDNNNNVIMEEYFNWDAGNSVWVPSNKTIYNYVNGDKVEMISQNWDTNTNQYVNNYKCEYNYVTITSIKENGEIVLSKCRFQNPFSNGAIICNLDNNQNYLFRIFDLSGRAVTQTTMKGGSLIFNQNLPDGMYIMVIEDETGKVVAKDKIIIQQ